MKFFQSIRGILLIMTIVCVALTFEVKTVTRTVVPDKIFHEVTEFYLGRFKISECTKSHYVRKWSRCGNTYYLEQFFPRD
jgi:hypothetical protein